MKCDASTSLDQVHTAAMATHSVSPVITLPLSYPLRRALGSLVRHFEDETVTDVFVNGPDQLWIDRGEGATREPGWMLDPAALKHLAVSLIALGGRHVDELNPCVDVRLERGIRVHVVLAPVSTSGTLISIRIPRTHHASLAELASAGLCDNHTEDTLRNLVAARRNVLITGPTGSGKTTLLAALLAEADERQRILTIEDVAELQIAHPHVVSLETRQPNLEGRGGIDVEQLVREALRMRPQRLVVGECRGPELRVLLTALNTGHDGGAGTLHASSLADVPARLEALGASAGIESHALARQVISAIDAVIHLEQHAGRRRIAHLGKPVLTPAGLLRIESLP